jgi:hypothetical protein
MRRPFRVAGELVIMETGHQGNGCGGTGTALNVEAVKAPIQSVLPLWVTVQVHDLGSWDSA